MENTFRAICAFCIIFLQFPLYYLAPLAVPYSDVMISDTNLCNNSIKQFLYKSEFTKDCKELKYPQDIDKLTLKKSNEEHFLCLGMHDTLYKLCQYTNNNKWTNTYNKEEDLDLSIQKLTGFKPTGERLSQNVTLSSKDFCKNLSGFTPMYEKTKSALSTLAKSLTNPDKCLSVCFDLDDTLVPLCALLAWINQIDQSVKDKVLIMTSTEQSHGNLVSNTRLNKLLPNEIKNEVNINHKDQLPNIVNSHNSPPSSNSVRDNEQITKKKLTQSEQTTTKPTQLPKPANSKIVSLTNASSSAKLGKNLTSESRASPVSSVHLNSTNTNSIAHSPQLQHNAKPTKTDEANKNMDLEQIKKITSSSPIEEVKSTTLSENTQDNTGEDIVANNQNPNDFNRINDDLISNNLIDSLNQPIDADNQDKNILETPGQREPENSLIIRNDEESHFFTYFAIISLGFIVGYIGYHNKQKILAIVLEGRRSKNSRGRRRPSTANYRKLDCTLEEAVTSQCNANVTHVIY